MTESQKCRTCGEVKLLAVAFSRDPGYTLGYKSQCKSCVNASIQRRRRANPEPMRARDREIKRRLSASAAYREKHALRCRIAQREGRKKRGLDNPLKTKSRAFLRRALDKGLVVKASACSDCGSAENIQAHHTDYSKPLEVTWLCHRCHQRLHRKPDMVSA